MTRAILVCLVVMATLLAAFPARGHVSAARPTGLVSLALKSYDTAITIDYDESPAALAYDVDISIGTTGPATTTIVAISAIYSYDGVPVSPSRASCSPRGPPPEFGSFLAAEGGDLTFYHGTSSKGAASIRQNGIDLSFSGPNNDFGRGFYMSADYDVALERAQQMFGEDAQVLTYKIPKSDLANLDHLQFDGPTEGWADFVRFQRQMNPDKRTAVEICFLG